MVDLKVPPGTDSGMFGDDDNEDYLDLSKVRSFQIELVKRITKDALVACGNHGKTAVAHPDIA